jgi:hypothetical protein
MKIVYFADLVARRVAHYTFTNVKQTKKIAIAKNSVNFISDSEVHKYYLLLYLKSNAMTSPHAKQTYFVKLALLTLG